jgi:hypothetical protein
MAEKLRFKIPSSAQTQNLVFILLFRVCKRDKNRNSNLIENHNSREILSLTRSRSNQFSRNAAALKVVLLDPARFPSTSSKRIRVKEL